jgi:hypothetical protein
VTPSHRGGVRERRSSHGTLEARRVFTIWNIAVPDGMVSSPMVSRKTAAAISTSSSVAPLQMTKYLCTFIDPQKGQFDTSLLLTVLCASRESGRFAGRELV